MKIVATIMLVMSVACLGQSFGDVIVTEIMQNPAAVSDAAGEWFEIYNSTGSAIDIDGWTIRDYDFDSHVINNGGPLLVPANGFLVLGNNDTTGINGGYICDYNYGTSWFLANGADEIVLETAGSTVIDSVAYDGGAVWPDPTGASMTLTNFQLDNNDGNNWTTSTAREPTYTGPTGDLGSPGTLGGDQSLPVSLTSFTASAGNNRVTLRWVTASEQENVGFNIMRASEKQGTYTQISTYANNPDLQGQFNSATQTNYRFIDQTVINGVTYWYKLVDVDVNGAHTEHGPMSATPHAVGNDVTTISAIPAGSFELHPNFPNPFNPSTTLRFDIPALSRQNQTVEVAIFNARGQRVKTLFKGILAPGTHELSWNGDSDSGTQVSSGMYYAKLRMDNLLRTSKMLLLK